MPIFVGKMIVFGQFFARRLRRRNIFHYSLVKTSNFGLKIEGIKSCIFGHEN